MADGYQNRFLNENLEDDVYMIQPTGFEDPKNAGKICKLLRSIYGLKQTSQSWNLRFDEEVKQLSQTLSPHTKNRK
jgi:Reverse transcriptase (RNA-dependent DNA polymerase)